MDIAIKEDCLSQLNVIKIALNSKPVLMSKPYNHEKTMVIAVDLVNGFVSEGNMAFERGKKMVAGMVGFFEKLPKAKKVFLRDCHGESSIEFKSFPKHCHTKTECSVVPALNEYVDVDVPKNSTNGFFNFIKSVPNFTSYHHFMVVGLCTDICVMQFALSLKAYLNEINHHGIVMTFMDFCDTYEAVGHDADLMNLFAFKVMEDAGIEIFKNVN